MTIEAEKEDFSDTMMEKMARFMHKKGLIFAPVQVVSVMKEQVPGRRQTKEQQVAAPPTPNVNNRPGRSTELNQDNIPIRTNQSETTIYHRAVESKRDSSSSEEIMDLSDETPASQFSIDHVHAVSESCSGDPPRQPTTESRNRYVLDDAQPHSLRQEAPPLPMRCQGGEGDREMTVQVEDLVRVAEASKACIYEVPGKLQTIEKYLEWPDLFHSVLVDEDYLVVGTHVDEATKRKIITGDYVDFLKLIPRNKVSAEDDHRMEIVNYSGQTFWIPASDGNAFVISNFIRWEQAFRVFSNIYTQQYPGHSSELIQYNHIIHTASLTYQWENVYQYNKEFRLHLIHHPECSWGVILQQAWSMYLKDKISANNQGGSPSNPHKSVKSKKICYEINSGYCSYATRCKFDHHCGVCGKYRHGTYNCRKATCKLFGSNSGSFNEFRDQGDHQDRGHSQAGERHRDGRKDKTN